MMESKKTRELSPAGLRYPNRHLDGLLNVRK